MRRFVVAPCPAGHALVVGSSVVCVCVCCVARARTRLALSVCRASPATACYIALLRAMRLRGSSPESRPAGHDHVVCEPYPIRSTDHIVVVVRHIQMRERKDLRASCLSPTATWFHPRGRAGHTGLRRTRAPLGQPGAFQWRECRIGFPVRSRSSVQRAIPR